MNNLFLKYDIFGWIATSIIFLFQHITWRPGCICFQGFCSPQTCHSHIRTEDHLPQPMGNNFLSQLICQEDGGSQRMKRGQAEVSLFLEGDCFSGHLQSRRDPLLRHEIPGNKLSVGVFSSLVERTAESNSKSLCRTACIYDIYRYIHIYIDIYNLVLGIQLKENSLQGYVLQEWTPFGSEEWRQACTGPSCNICWANRKAGSWTGGSEVHAFSFSCAGQKLTQHKICPITVRSRANKNIYRNSDNCTIKLPIFFPFPVLQISTEK